MITIGLNLNNFSVKKGRDKFSYREHSDIIKMISP